MSDTSDLGRSIKDAFLFLEPVFKDTAKLLSIVEDAMNRAKLVPVWGAASVWDRSSAYYGDYGWIAHYLNRVYVPKPDPGQKSDFSGKAALFVTVYFRPERLVQPVIMYGVMKICTGEGFWPFWHDTMAQKSGPPFLNQDRSEEWARYKEDEVPLLEEMWYQVRPLVEIKDNNAVEKLCSEVIKVFRECHTPSCTLSATKASPAEMRDEGGPETGK